MRWNKHSRLEGEHAFPSPSSYHWINYSPERLAERWITSRSAMSGTQQHDYACRQILAGRLSTFPGTLGMFINDAIELKLTPEQPLFYSENCFGTADAIGFRYRKLIVGDLKTGISKPSVHQLEVYDALFCLEYEVDPRAIKHELRIYWQNECHIFEADPEEIWTIMEKIQESDRLINQLRLEEES